MEADSNPVTSFWKWLTGGDDSSGVSFDISDIDPGLYSGTSDPNFGGSLRYGYDDPGFEGSKFFIGDESDPYGGYDLSELPSADYSNEGRNYPTPESTQGASGSPINATTDLGKPADLLSFLKSLPGDVANFAQENPWLLKLLAGGLGAYIGSQNTRPPTGGGVATAYAPKTRYVRTIEQSKYGPYAKHTRVPRTAADGGIMHAYRHGGEVKPFPMQDGGFVMTKKAVDGAGGPQGLAALVPEARMIGGPPDPTGRKDLTPAYIQGSNGRTPARVSRGEAYVPPGRDTRQLYAMMRALERKA